MTSSSRRFVRFSLPSLGFALLMMVPTDIEAAQFRHLCTSNPWVCTYTGPTAPTLAAEVCFGSAIGIRLKGSGACPSGSWPYYLDYGEVVDPITNHVVAYIPLDNACDQPGLCVDGPPPAGAQEFPMCCTGNSSGGDQTCYSGTTCGGTLWFCYDGVCNADGTVTCFDAVGGGS